MFAISACSSEVNFIEVVVDVIKLQDLVLLDKREVVIEVCEPIFPKDNTHVEGIIIFIFVDERNPLFDFTAVFLRIQIIEAFTEMGKLQKLHKALLMKFYFHELELVVNFVFKHKNKLVVFASVLSVRRFRID